jgi:hypothetical protein
MPETVHEAKQQLREAKEAQSEKAIDIWQLAIQAGREAGTPIQREEAREQKTEKSRRRMQQ